MEDKSIMVNLGDEKAKEISEVIGSKSCNKVLNLLAEGDLTVSDISGKLKMPINTVDYNVKKLRKAGLIEKASHFWSVKGKRMPTYKVSNRKIIISPRKSMAKIFGWTLGLTGLVALTIREFTKVTDIVTDDLVVGSSKIFAETATASLESAPVILDGAQGGSAGFIQFLSGVSPWSWFLFGAWFAIFLFFAFTLYIERRNR